MKLSVNSLCEDASSSSVFSKKCYTYILQSGIFPLLEDDQVDDVCTFASANNTSCDLFSKALVDYYYEVELRDVIQEQGYYMTGDYMDSVLKMLDSLLISQTKEVAEDPIIVT